MAQMDNLQAALKEFDTATAFLNKLSIQYFWNGLRPQTWVQLDKQDQDIVDWQEAIKCVVNTKTKINRQTLSLTLENDACCPHNQQSIKREFQDPKNSKIKKISNTPITDQNSSGDGQTSQSGQTLSQSRNKNSHLQRGKKDQSSNTLATSVNTTIIKKDHKYDDRDLSQIEYFAYHKKGHYMNKYPNKELKN